MSFGKELRAKRIAAGYRYRRAFCKAADVSYSRVTELELEVDWCRPETIESNTLIKLALTAKWDLNELAKTMLPYIKWRKHELPEG